MTMALKFLSNITFANPEKNKVAILHEYDFWLKEVILKDLPSTTLGIYPQGYKLYVTPKLIALLLLRLRFISWLGFLKGMTIKGLFKQIYGQYVLACLDQIDAKVVLTSVDNSGFFHNLTRMDKRRTYFAIQNGTRTLACVRDALPLPPHPFSTISMSNFFCFGKRDIDLFKAHGHKIDSYFPVGSLVGGYYKSVVSAPAKEQKFDLCLISQWHEHFFDEIEGDDFPQQVARRVRAGMEGLNNFLLRLLSETNLSMLICPRNDAVAAERQYYENIFGNRATIINSDRNNFSTYRAIEQCKLAIALNSTMLAEVFSWGQKVLWCNVPDDEHYEMPEAGHSYFHGGDYNAFKERVLELLEMPQDNYEKLTREGARYICNFDPINPPHEIIRSAVINTLSNAN
jgi:surface carbohydrate biosynthesis protein